jgi:hypothetical protein
MVCLGDLGYIDRRLQTGKFFFSRKLCFARFLHGCMWKVSARERLFSGMSSDVVRVCFVDRV